MHLIRFSEIQDKEELLKSIVFIYGTIMKIQSNGFQKGPIKLHFNGEPSQDYFEVVQKAKEICPSLRALIKVRLNQYEVNKENIDSFCDEIMLRDSISFTEKMIEYAQQNSHIIVQVRANGNDADEEFITKLQNSGVKWKLNPYSPSDEDEAKRIAKSLDTNKTMPSNIKNLGKEEEISYWIENDGSYKFDKSSFRNHREKGGAKSERTAEYNAYYEGIENIRTNLT